MRTRAHALLRITASLLLALAAAAVAGAEGVAGNHDGKWIVRWVGDRPDAEFWARAGLTFIEEVKNLDQFYVVAPDNASAKALLEERESSKLRPYQRRDSFLRQYWRQRGEPLPDLLWSDPLQDDPVAGRLAPTPTFADPRLAGQWHLHNTGQISGVSGEDANIFAAWRDGFSGRSIVIGIVDEGVDPQHEDLTVNFRSDLSFNFVNNNNQPAPQSFGETHGNAVAAIAAASQNGVGGVGVAYNARIASLRALDDRDNLSFVTNATMAGIFNHRNQDIHIYNNSWGYRPSSNFNLVGFVNTTAQALFQNALATGAREGRGGLGAIYIWSAGNSNLSGDDVNLDQIVNSPYTIAVGAVGDSGRHAPYSNRGAALHLVAPSSGNNAGVSTALRFLNGHSSYRKDFGGTSAAAPIVAGVVALMLEANPQLTWRDVQHILLLTAVEVDPEHRDWARNAAGRHINHSYGFGRVDAGAAVRLARRWAHVQPAEEAFAVAADLSLAIPQSPALSLSSRLFLESDLQLEHVQLSLTLSAGSNWDNLDIRLLSPSGTESILLRPFNSVNNPSGNSWMFSTLRKWGESSAGEWTLVLRNSDGTAAPGTLREWALIASGTPRTEGETPSGTPDREPVRVRTLDTQAAVNIVEPAESALGRELLSIYRPARGDAWIDDQGQVQIRIDPEFRGLLKIPYTVALSANQTATGVLEFVNPRPIASSSRIGALINFPRTLFPLDNDEHPDGSPLTITGFDQPESGTVRQLNGTTLQWIPDPTTTAPGVFSFGYTIEDPEGQTASATMEMFFPAEDDFSVFFSKNDSYARVDPSPDINLRRSMTLEAWINPEGFGPLEGSGFGRIIDKEAFLLFLNASSPFYDSNSLVFFLRQEGGTSTARYSPQNSIRLREWTHVAATYDGATDVRLYINGQPVTAHNPANRPGSPDPASFAPLRGPLIPNSDEPLFFGDNRDRSRGFEGRIDEVRIWNRVRSAAEIRDNYDRPLQGFEPGLVGYWPMIEARTDRLIERSGRSGNARLVNTTWDSGRVPGLVPDTFVDARFLSPAWRLSRWLGLFFEDNGSPWIYHREHGWLFPSGDSADHLHLYDPVLETWLWTASSLYPMLYRYDQARWTYFDPNSSNPRYFYNYATASWESVPRPTH